MKLLPLALLLFVACGNEEDWTPDLAVDSLNEQVGCNAVEYDGVSVFIRFRNVKMDIIWTDAVINHNTQVIGFTDMKKIWITTKISDNYKAEVLLHELGHNFLLKDTDDTTKVMSLWQDTPLTMTKIVEFAKEVKDITCKKPGT